ncbi:MAG: hypothetical protein QOI55_1154, partial [Actinomycetota bacterium]|nr:hypothetical protein [Actinomycetota bacterium]
MNSVSGDDRTLARWVVDHPGALVAFRPSSASDLARAVGLRGDPGTTELSLDALRLGDGDLAVNMIVVGTPPDRSNRFTRHVAVDLRVDDTNVATSRASTIVIATGQYLRGLDVVPRGHPGDGRLEVYVYRLRPRERRAMRARLPHGTHVPHPRITVRPGHHVELVAARPVP